VEDIDRAVAGRGRGRARLTLGQVDRPGLAMHWFLSAALEGTARLHAVPRFRDDRRARLARVGGFRSILHPADDESARAGGPDRRSCDLMPTGRFLTRSLRTDRLLAENGKVVRGAEPVWASMTVTVSSRPELSLSPPDRPAPAIHHEVGA